MKNVIKQILREGLITEERIKFSMNVPEDIVQIKDVFKANNFVLYLVGGCVRDAILNIQPKDYDLVTDANPDKVEELMKGAGYKTLPTGKSFGVINVFTDKGEYEIATMREDVGKGRRPDSVVFSDINTDSQRRDLTSNALYYDIDKFEIIDLVGGVNDVKNGIVRTVGDPQNRFEEDRLRILRVCRFAGRFGSELDPATDAALQKDASLDGISGERIRDEFIKGIKSAKSVKHFLELINKYGLFKWIFPDLNINLKFIENTDPIIVIASLLKDNSLDSLGKKLNSLKYKDDEAKAIRFLIGLLNLSVNTAVVLKRAQQHSTVTPEQIKDFGRYEHIDSKLLTAFLSFNLSVSGEELMARTGIKAGPELGKEIQRLETDNFKKLL